MMICFDMDGTIADLYGVEGWLNDLENENTRPYREARPLLNLSLLARYLNKIQRMGHNICVISWLSKSGTPDYNAEVAEVKREWLAKHLPSVAWDAINIVPYGTPKSLFGTDILFDDEERNRKEWQGTAYDVQNIIEVLKGLL